MRSTIRSTVTSLLRTPGLTAAALLSLVLAIAATTTVFSVVDASLLRPPPFHDPDRLVMVYTTRRDAGGTITDRGWSWQRLLLLRRLSSAFSAIGSVSVGSVALTDGVPEPATVEIATDGYFRALDIASSLGRIFTPDENDGAGAHPVVLVSHDLAARRFGGDAAVMGRVIHLNGVPLTVVGVLPSGFTGITGRAQLWITPSMAPRLTYDGYLTTNQDFISVVARLRPGVDVERARRELVLVGADIQRAAPSTKDVPEESYGATVLPLNEARVKPATRQSVLLLLGAAGFLLLLSCTNVAVLLLGRGISRRRELAIRAAIGASRGRVVRQLHGESLLLAAVAAAAGSLIAVWTTSVLPMPPAQPNGFSGLRLVGEFAMPHLDARVLAFVVVLTLLVTMLFGLAPALRASGVNLTDELKATAGASTHGRRFELRHALLMAEVVLAVVLLAGGGLLLASYRRLQNTDLGFEPDHLIIFLIRPSEVKYSPAKAPALIDRVLAELRAVPGVDAATVDACTPLDVQCASSTLYVIGRPEPRADQAPPVLRHYVAPDHFHTLHVPVIRGRAFTDQDRAGAPRVAIINETAARRFWPGQNPIGQRVWFGGGSSFDRPDSSAEIVGIVGDVPYQALDRNPVQADFYTPYAQFTYASRTVIVRTQVDAGTITPALRQAVRRADPDLALFDVRTMFDRAGDSWARQRYQTRLVTAFAVVALLLAAVGIFAVVGHAVAERRREIGIRSALGAQRLDVLRAVAGRVLLFGAAGLLAGLLAATAVARIMTSMLYRTSPLDPVVLGGVSLVLAGVMALSAWLPARQALRIDPLQSLRAD